MAAAVLDDMNNKQSNLTDKKKLQDEDNDRLDSHQARAKTILIGSSELTSEPTSK